MSLDIGMSDKVLRSGDIIALDVEGLGYFSIPSFKMEPVNILILMIVECLYTYL